MGSTTNKADDNKVDFSFKKEERLCSKKISEKLFAEGVSFLSFPLKIVYFETALYTKFPVQAAFAVSKKNFKKAVHRNFIKRKIRETYRLNKHLLYDNLVDKQIAIFFIFIGKELPEYKLMEEAMKKGIKKLIDEFSTKTCQE